MRNCATQINVLIQRIEITQGQPSSFSSQASYMVWLFVRKICQIDLKRCNIAVGLIVYAMPLLRNHAILVYTYRHWWKHECLYHDLPPLNITPQISLCWNSPKMALLNIIPLSQSLENSQSIPVIRVHHRAAPNHLLAQRMHKILQQESSQFVYKAAYMAWVFSSIIYQNRLVRIETNFASWTQIKFSYAMLPVRHRAALIYIHWHLY